MKTRTRIAIQAHTRPLWTPDAQRIVFSSDRAGYPEIFWRPADRTGSDERLRSGRGAASTTSGGSSVLPTTTASDLTFCVDETNRYRAMRGRPALTRSTTIEQFAADGAKSDALANAPHQHVLTTPFPGGGAWAENEVLRWPYNLAPTVQGIVAQAILSFYSEGPGGGHYENIVGAYAQMGCGIYIDTNGITIIEDFR